MKHNNRFIYLTHALIDGLCESIPVLLAFALILSSTPEKEIGLVVSIGMFFSTLLGLITTAVNRKTSTSFIFFCSLMTYGITFLMAAFSPSIFITKICFTLALSVTSFFHITAFSYLMLSTDIHSRGRTMSDFTATGDIGRIPFASFAAFIAAYTLFNWPGWRLFCILFGLVAIAFAFYQYMHFHEEKPVSAEFMKKRTHKGVLPSFSLLKNRSSRLAILACMLDALCNGRIFTFFPILLISKGIETTHIVYFTFMYTFGSLAGKVILGRLADHIKPAFMFMICELLMAAALWLLVLTDQPLILFCLAALLGTVSRGTVPVAQVLVADTVEQEHYGDIISIRDFGVGIISIITPALYGYLASRFGLNVIYHLMACGALLASIPIILSIRSSTP